MTKGNPTSNLSALGTVGNVDALTVAWFLDVSTCFYLLVYGLSVLASFFWVEEYKMLNGKHKP